MKILIDENIPLLPEVLASCGEIQTFAGRSLRRDDLVGTQALFVRSVTKVNQQLLEGTSVQFLGTATAGTDHIDRAALRRDIVFADAKGSNANAVAEYVVYAILQWLNLSGESLSGKRIGIIGFGAIGKRVAALAHSLSLQVAVSDPLLRDAGYAFPPYCDYREIDDLLSQSHIITNHVPLEYGGLYPTSALLGKTKLEKIPVGSLFVHTSRGGVVDESALVSLLQKRQLMGALDVWEHEPAIRVELAESTMLCTPHIAGYSWEGKLRGSLMMADAFSVWAGCTTHREIILHQLISHQNTSYGNSDELFSLLQTYRAFAEDDQNFRATFSLEPDQRALAFDMLRRQYPQKHEVLPVQQE